MASRFQCTFKDYNENYSYTLTIDDSDHVGGITTFAIAADSMQIIWKPETSEIFNPILSSSLSFQMVIDTGTLNAFISDLNEAPEGRFRIKVERDGTIYWVGYILTDRITKQDKAFPILFEVRAEDGLERLKTIDYNNSGVAYTGKDTILDHIGKVLAKIELDDFYGASDAYLVTCVDLFEDTYIGVSSSTYDPLNYNRFKHKAFIKTDENNNKEYLSCYDVIKEICTATGTRFLYSQGAYRIISYWNYQYATGSNIRTYTKSVTSFTHSGSTNLAVWTSELGDPADYLDTLDLVKLAGGVVKWYPPLSKARVIYNHFAADNLIETLPADGTSITVEDVDSNSGVATLNLYGTIQYNLSLTSVGSYSYIYVVFNVTCQVGSYYLNRDVTISSASGAQISATTWENSAQTFQVFLGTSTYGTSIGSIPLSFGGPSPAIPAAADGDMTFGVALAGVYRPDGVALTGGGTDYTITWQVTGPRLELYINGTLSSQAGANEYAASNSNSGNSREIEVETLIGSGPNLTAAGALEAYSGSAWSLAEDYRYGYSGTTYDLGRVIANNMIAFQSDPVERLIVPMIGLIEAHHKLKVVTSSGAVTTYYIWAGGKFDLSKNIWDGEWFKVQYEAADVVPINTKPIYIDDIRQKPQRPPIDVTNPGPSFPVLGGDLNAVRSLTPATTGAALTAVSTNTMTIDSAKSAYYWYDNDEIRLIDSTGYLEDRPVIRGDYSSGTSLAVDSFTPTQVIRTGSKIMFDPEFFYKRFAVNRRKQYSFHLIDRTTDISVTTPGEFFRPLDWMVNVRVLKLGYSFSSAGSSDTSITLKLMSGTATAVYTFNISGAVTDGEADPGYVLADDVHWFDITAASATTMPKGLQMWIELVY